MGRRTVFFLFSVAVTAAPRPKLGDTDWMRRFREFVKAFNDFVITLNDDKLDVTKWERMRSAWLSVATTQSLCQINNLRSNRQVPVAHVKRCYNSRFVIDFILALLAAFRVFFRSRRHLALENLALR